MGTVKQTSHHVIHKKSPHRHRLLILIPLFLALLLASVFALKHLYPHHKHSKDAKHDIRRLESRLEESQRQVHLLSNSISEYHHALTQLKEDFITMKRQQQPQTSREGPNETFMVETKKKLSQIDDRLDGLVTHVMVAMQDIEDIREGSSPYDALLVEAQDDKKTEVLTGTEGGDETGGFKQWKKELSEAVKESLSRGKEMTQRAVEKAKETTKAMGQKMQDTGSQVKEGVYDGAKKTKEFFAEKGQGIKSAMSSLKEKVKDVSGKAKEQTKKFAQGVKDKAKSMVKKVGDLKDSFMKMFR